MMCIVLTKHTNCTVNSETLKDQYITTADCIAQHCTYCYTVCGNGTHCINAAFIT